MEKSDLIIAEYNEAFRDLFAAYLEVLDYSKASLKAEFQKVKDKYEFIENNHGDKYIVNNYAHTIVQKECLTIKMKVLKQFYDIAIEKEKQNE